MSQQLVKKGANGRMVNVNPKSWIEAIKDKNTGQTLVEILQGFNMYFLPYNGNTSSTRCLVPTMLRKKGLWITYVKYDGNVYTEWYAADELDDKYWGDSSNWRVGNNTLVGDITISANGNWVINGTETEFKAVGEKGNTPLIRVANNRLQVSYDLGDTYRDVTNNPVYTKFRWLATSGDTQANNVGRIQASTDEGKTWTNMSNDFTNNLHIKKYIGVNESLPTSGIAEGTIYAKGPTYADEDTSHANPIYRLWVYAWKGNTLAWQDNGEFTSIAAGVVQETGDSETEVMSQKAVSKNLYELNQKVGTVVHIVDSISNSNAIKLIFDNLNIKEGESFSIKLNGTIGNRTILRYNDKNATSNNLKDYMTTNVWYQIIAPTNIESLWLWYDKDINLSCELRKDLASEVVKHEKILEDVIGTSIHIADFVSSGNSTKLLFSNLNIKEGESFSIKLIGSAASRTILRYNDRNSLNNNLKDYIQTETLYQFIAPSNIESLWLWYNGDIDITCELKKGLSSVIINNDETLRNSSGLKTEIFDTLDGVNSRKVIFNNIYIKQGESLCIRLSGEANGRLIVRYNYADSSANNVKDYIELDTWYQFTAPTDITSLWLWYDCNIDLVCEIRTSIGTEDALFDIIQKSPLSVFPAYIKSTMAYKPLGSFDSGYLCISDDDGRLGLITYTIPMVLRKEFPITFSLMKESEVMNNDSYIQQIKNAIETIGCSVAQHGGKNWTEYSERGLYDYFKSQSDFFAEKDIKINGAVIPSHYTNEIIEAIAGGTFGVVRCGYDGKNSKGEKNYHTIYDSNYTPATSIPRSNMYCLSSCNILDYPFETWKSVIDNAIINKKLINIYFHDVDFTSEVDNYEDNRQLLENVIDYAKTSGIKIIQIGDIPKLL